MRPMKTLFVAALVLAVTSTAWAISIPPEFPGGNATYVRTDNRDNGTGYTGNVGTYTRTDPNTPFAGLTVSKPVGVRQIPGRPTGVTEDTYGIFDWHQMQSGNFATNDVTVGSPPNVTYSWVGTTMTGNTALVGVFYGGWDRQVVLSGSDPLNPSLDTYTSQVSFKLYAVDAATLGSTGLAFGEQGPAFNPASRTAIDQYANWVDGTDPNKVLLFSGTSTYFHFHGTENTTSGTFDGATDTFWKFTGGLWDTPQVATNVFTDPNGVGADLKLTFNIHSGTNGWTVNSDDNGGFASTIPEPLTMVGLFLGVGGLGRYLRRRFA